MIYLTSLNLRFFCSAFFIRQLSHPYMTTGKTIALTRWIFAGKIMSVFFNMLSRLVIAFLPRSKCLLISWLQSPLAVILEPKKDKICHCFYYFPIYLPWSDGTGCHTLENNYTNEVLVLLQKSKGPQQTSQPGDLVNRQNSQGIWLWRPVGFDYRTSTGLGK